jgi:preprotein translocase subunit YajC
MIASISVLMINLYIIGLFVVPYLWIIWRRRRRNEERRVLIG